MFPTSITLCLFICATISPKGNHSADEYVDLIELNHFYDQQGRLVYDQVIFYERAPETGRFQVRAWCLVEDRDCLNRRPIKNQQTDLYQVDWYDTDQRLLRKITSRLYRESWTQIDPERVNKKLHDERSRISMVQNPKKFLASETQPFEEAKQTTIAPANIASSDVLNGQTPPLTVPPSTVPAPARATAETLVAR